MLRKAHTILLWACLFLAAPAIAQRNVFHFSAPPDLRQSSSFVYIYAIPADSVYDLVYRWGNFSPGADWMRRPIAIVSAAKPKNPDSVVGLPSMPPGYYLCVSAFHEKIRLRVIRKRAFRMLISNLEQVKVLHLRDTADRELRDARVLLQDKELPYDSSLGGFVLDHFGDGDIISVRWEADADFLRCTSEVNYDYAHPQRLNERQEAAKAAQLFNGYLVTNKPTYLPHDTVKWKAYLEDPQRRNRLVREPLRLSFSDHDGYRNYIIAAKYEAAEPGVYFGEFVLGDTVATDRLYNLELYGLHTGMRLRQTFRTEDYLLGETHLRVTGEGLDRYGSGDTVKLFAYAYNSNNLPVGDGELHLTILPGAYDKYPKQPVFIPDTLYSATLPTAADGETPITFSTKDFPAALTSFKCVVSFSASDNEHADTSFTISYTSESQYPVVTAEGGMLHARLISHKKEISAPGSMSFDEGEEDEVENFKTRTPVPITFPFDYRIGPYDHAVTFSLLGREGADDDLSATYTVTDAGLYGVENFVGDTAVLELYNPWRVRYRYSIFIGNEFYDYGVADGDTSIKVYSPKGRTVSLIGAYIWRDTAHSRRFNIYKLDRELRVELRKKNLVYPGQRDTLTVGLSNRDGEPVGRTNVTVLAFNARFPEDYTPDVPYAGKRWSAYSSSLIRRVEPMRFYFDRQEAITPTWLERCGADTLFFYRHLYFLPDGVAWVTYDIPKSAQPQLCVYLKSSTEFYRPEVVYVDAAPVYIHQVNSTNPEGYFVPEGRHSLRIRTNNAEYSIPNFEVCAGMKTDLYLNTDSVGPYKAGLGKPARSKASSYFCEGHLRTFASRIPRPDTLQNGEKDGLARYIFLYRNEALAHNSGQSIQTIPGIPQIFQGLRQLQGFRRYDNDYRDPRMLFGPVSMADSAAFFQQFNTRLRFLPEPSYIFTFRPQMTRVEKISVDDYLRWRLEQERAWPSANYTAPDPTPPDSLTFLSPGEGKLELIYNTQKGLRREDSFGYSIDHAYPHWPDEGLSARMQVSVVTRIPLRYLIIRKPGDTAMFVLNFLRTDVGLKPGTYQVMALWKNGRYTLTDTLLVRQNGVMMVSIPYRADGVLLLSNAPGWLQPFMRSDTLNGNFQYYSVAAGRSEGFEEIRGTLVDEKGYPITNASVELFAAGTRIDGTVTDFDGEYLISVPGSERYSVKFSYQGNDVTITDILVEAHQRVVLNATLSTAKMLSAVVVHSIRTYKAPTIDFEKPGGLTVRSAEYIEHAPTRSLSDIASLSTQSGIGFGGGRPGLDSKYIVDGLELPAGSKAFTNLPPYSVESSGSGSPGTGSEDKPSPRNGLLNRNNDASRAFFSAFMSNMTSASGLRKSFRDWAIWEPNLWTGEEGKATFSATYPDNMTSWKTYVLAMNREGYAARALRVTRAFKPLGAQLSAPRFLRYGDTAEAIGKVANYTQMAFALHSRFSQDGRLLRDDTMLVHNTRISRLRMTASPVNTIDTAQLPVTYSINAANGYTDGEERTLPVYPLGVVESKGAFSLLNGDTALSFAPDPAAGHFSGRARLMVDGSLLEVMLHEVMAIKEYPHGCNEQLTTKLLAIYYEEAIKTMLGRKDFNNRSTKKKILDQLIRAQRPDGGFGWWSGNGVDARITTYIVSTMQKVNADGWLSYIIRRGNAYLDAHLTDMNPSDRLAALQTLATGGYASNYTPLLAELDTIFKHSVYHQLSIAKIRKELGLPYRKTLDSLMNQRHETMQGMYWSSGERYSYDWYRDDLASTLLAYALTRGDSLYGRFAEPIVRYLLWQRRRGCYRSTASSGLVLTTLLPDLLKENPSFKKLAQTTYVRISGSVQDSVTSFPKSYAIRNAQPRLQLVKQGINPVYVSIVYDYFNTQPVTHDSGFSLRSYFLNRQNDTVTVLKAGERITLCTIVTCRKDAEYIIVNVPIPAGCVQVEKGAVYNTEEAARENFKDQTCIFYNRLHAGTYIINVLLEARYKGVYNMSPARAGMMYYQEEYGNTVVKRVRIE